MKEEIAVATTSGKAYYLIVNKLKRKNAPFLSLTPYEPVPVEIKVVITTEREKHLINHERVLTYQNETELEALINKALQITQGKESFQKIVIGIDPGEVFGLALLADGKIVETENCFSIEETLTKIKDMLRSLENTPAGSVSVKIGDGVPECKERLLRVLDEALPLNVMLETVREAGTNHFSSEAKHRRGLRDIVSATQIAGRSGHTFQRRKISEQDS